MINGKPSPQQELNRLSTDDQEAFAWLGILHEGAVVRPAAVATLWEQPETEARQRLQRFGDAALLQPVSDEGYHLQSAMRAEATQQLSKRMPLPEAHARLLERYRAQTRDGLWHTLPDDGYIYDHLTWHMTQAGWQDEIHALLREETPEGRNGWHVTRLSQGQPDGFLQDVARARQLADERGDVGLQCRYALIATSASSPHDAKLRALLPRLVETGIWSPERGLAHALKLPLERRRAKALAQLAQFLPEPLYADALTAVREIGDGESQGRALADLASYLPASSGASMCEEILAAARELQDSKGQAIVMSLARAEILSSLAPRLANEQGEHLIAEMLDQAYGIEYPASRWSALAALVPHLPERARSRVLKEMLSGVREIEHPYTEVMILAELVPFLSNAQRGRLLADALIAPRGFEFREVEEQLRDGDAELVTGLASHLSKPRPPEPSYAELVASLAANLSTRRLRKALFAVREAREAGDRAEALAALAPHLPQGLQENALRYALAAAKEEAYHPDRMRVLLKVASVLPEAEREPVLEEALAATRQIGDWEAPSEAKRIEAQQETAVALARLAPRFPEPRRTRLFDEALAVARNIEPAGSRALVLAHVAPHLCEHLQVQTALEVWAWADEQVKKGNAKVLTYGPLLCVPQSLIGKVLDTVRRIKPDQTLVWVLIHLIPRLPESVRAQALTNIFRLESEEDKALCLSMLGHYMHKPLLREILVAGRTIGDGEMRTRALWRLAPHLLPSQRELLLTWTLAGLEPIGGRHRLGWALEGLIPHLPEALLEQALAAARTIEHRIARPFGLIAVAQRLQEPQRAQALEDALAAVSRIPIQPLRNEIMLKVAKHLPEPRRGQVLAKVLDSVSGLAPKDAWKSILESPSLYPLELILENLAISSLDSLGEPWQEEALAAARITHPAAIRASAFTDLAPYLAGSSKMRALEEALVAAREIEGTNWLHADSLLRVAAHLPDLQKAEVLQEALAAALKVEPPIPRSRLWTELAAQLPEPQRVQALDEALSAAREIEQPDRVVEALACLAPLLPQTRQLQVLAEAVELVRGRYPKRGGELSQLAVSLVVLPTADLYPLWLDLLQQMSTCMRSELLSGIGTLAPVIVSLGGPDAAAKTFRAIQDVGRWWP